MSSMEFVGIRKPKVNDLQLLAHNYLCRLFYIRLFNIDVHKVGYGEDSLKEIANEIIETLRKYNPETLSKPLKTT